MSAATTIKKLRIQLLMQREEFAKLIGITKGAVYNYETGARIPKLSIVRKMKELAEKNGIQIPVEDFLD